MNAKSEQKFVIPPEHGATPSLVAISLIYFSFRADSRKFTGN
jgi:hypothetical protein